MARLSMDRKGEIALLILKNLKKKDGLVFTAEELTDDAKHLAQEINISEPEALAFAKDFVEELLTESLQELSDMK